MAQTSRPCMGCGTAILRTSKTGPIPPYCSEDCKPRCTVMGCSGSIRKRTWCASHYAQWQRTGKDPAPFKYRWATPTPCKVCGGEPGGGYREFCGGPCRVLWATYNGAVPTSVDCVACGVSISLIGGGKNGRRINATVKLCRRCKHDYDKYKMSARELAVRDGTDCGICGESVDMSLRRADSLMCPSVDHVVPRSKGGTHEPENLQLAHLYCNHVKSDRTEEVA